MDITTLQHFFEAYPWGIYVCLLIAPFIQEDAAVIGAAAASVAGGGDTVLLFLSILTGLTLSDLWKYWAGRLAHSQKWAKKFSQKPGVLNAQEKVKSKLAVTLMIVRFVPGTRIPFYVASGFFNAPFSKFAFFVAFSALLYIGIIFALFHALGEVVGENIKTWLPVIAVTLMVVLITVQFIKKRKRKAAASTAL